MDFKIGYYYLTINNQLKFRKLEDVKEPMALFDDPFINKWWRVEKESDYIAMIIEVEQSVYTCIMNQKSMRAGESRD